MYIEKTQEDIEMAEDFLTRLSRLMDERHLTQADIARMCGTGKSRVNAWFRGALPGSDILVKLSGQLGVSAEWLMGGSPAYGCPYSDTCHEHDGISLVERFDRADEVTRKAIISLLDASERK